MSCNILHIYRRLSACLVVMLCLCAVSFAQSNPYGIDERCYDLYRKAAAQTDFLKQTDAARELRELAIELGDTKAETLSYVQEYIAYTHHFANDLKAQEQAARRLMDNALENGYDQYYFYAYSQGIAASLQRNNYMYALDLAERMLADATELKSDFGFWTCYRCLGNIYTARWDKKNARKYFNLAIDYYPKVSNQSVSRVYSDLAATYEASNDSSILFLKMSLQTARTSIDSTYASSRLARYYGLRNDRKNFTDAYQLFSEYSRNTPNQGYTKSDSLVLDILNDIVFNRLSQAGDKLDSLSLETDFTAQAYGLIAKRTGHYRQAYEASELRRDNLESAFSMIASSDIASIAERMQNDLLRQEVDDKTLKLERSTIALLILAGSVLLAIILILAIYSYYRNKNNRRLVEFSHQLERARDEALKANSMKTQFIQNMSHEIRTPLNAIVGFSQLLGLPDYLLTSQERDTYIEYIRSNSDMLTMLVDDILNLADMEHGNFVVEFRAESINNICRRAMNTVQYRVPPGVKMTFTSDVEDSVLCSTDDRRVIQVLINYLTNACKHTQEGEIHLDCSLKANPGKITFSVSDTGPGVPAEMAEKIFDRFIKLNSFKQGTGLGLNICRQIAERLDGAVFLDTSYSPGARFVFVIPLINP